MDLPTLKPPREDKVWPVNEEDGGVLFFSLFVLFARGGSFLFLVLAALARPSTP